MSEPQDRLLRVFLCHSSHDRPAVRELYRRLSAEGWIDVWLDTEKLYPGQDWSLEIEQAVEVSDVILICLSKNSVTKEGYVQRELRIVLDLADYKPEGTLFIIPVRLEECDPPRRLRTWQYADYFPKEEQERAYARLLVSLQMRATRLGISTVSLGEDKADREVGGDIRIKKDDSGRNITEKHPIKTVETSVAEGGGSSSKKSQAYQRTNGGEQAEKDRIRHNRTPAKTSGTKAATDKRPDLAPAILNKEITSDKVRSKKQDPHFDELEKVRAVSKQTGKIIRAIGVGVIALLMIVIIWFQISNREPQKQTTLNYGSELPACQPFADIPVALQYSEPPLKIDISKQYFAIVTMAKGGKFVIQLYPDRAPKTVNSFVFLSCKGYFNGVTFHRVLEGFMAQGGDPTGTGTGGPGYYYEYEGSDLTFDKAGIVAMANTGPATPTNGSQFFITFDATPQLNDGYTIFGQVIEGMDVVNGITRRDPEQAPDFEGDAIETITITEQ